MVHDTEDHMETVRLAADTARKRLSQAKLQLRLKRKEFENDTRTICTISKLGMYIHVHVLHV